LKRGVIPGPPEGRSPESTLALCAAFAVVAIGIYLIDPGFLAASALDPRSIFVGTPSVAMHLGDCIWF